MRRLGFLIWKELLELKADPSLLGIVVVAPLIQLVALGYAATTDITDVPLVVADADRTPASRALVERFRASRTFTIVDEVSAPAEIDPFIERGRAWMALVIPPGLGAALAAGAPERVQVIADGSDSNSANIGLGYAVNLVAAYAEELAAARRFRAGAPPPPGVEARIRVWFNPQLRSRDFMIPGIVAMLLLVVTTNLSSMAIVRERELGTLEQLNVTPLRRSELILGKLLPYALVGVIDVLLVLAVARWWFAVPLRGSVWLLLGMTAVYLLTALGLGLFVSTISSTQQQAMITTMLFFLMPMMYLSGFVFPIENMPRAIQLITFVIPLRYFLVIVRGIFLEGAGLGTLWPDALALLAWGAGILVLATLRSSKRAA